MDKTEEQKPEKEILNIPHATDWCYWVGYYCTRSGKEIYASCGSSTSNCPTCVFRDRKTFRANKKEIINNPNIDFRKKLTPTP